MTGPPRLEVKPAPPGKRAKPDGVPVRLHDGTLVAHVGPELEDRLLKEGAAESFRNGPRRYLRLRQGILIPRTVKGWDIIEFLRWWQGDKKAASYIRHKDRQSENVRYEPPTRLPESPRLCRLPEKGAV
jgi:hypothetical protein